MFSKKKRISIFVLIVLLIFPSLLLAQGMSGQGIFVDGHAVSTDNIPQASYQELLEQPSREVPKPFDEELYLYKHRLINGLILPESIDSRSLMKDSAFESSPTSILLLNSDFAGMGYTDWNPPDPILAVGPDHIVEMVNSSWAIFDKTGNKLYQTTLYDWWSNVSPSGAPYDPKLIFDQESQRWVLLAAARSDATGAAEYLISVSDDANPLGTWCNWKLDATLNGSTVTNSWADYPQIGSDDTAIYITSNQFSYGTFLYSKLRILKKSEVYQTSGCSAITWWDFWNFENADSSSVFTWQPVRTLNSSSREWLVNTVDRLSGDAITLWSVTNAGTWPPTLTREATIPVQHYGAPPDAKQLGGSSLIDTGDSRLYNAVCSGNKIYTSTTENCDWGTSDNVEACVRFVVIDTISKTVTSDSRLGADNFYYFYPAICPDNYDNVYAGFSRSGSTEYAGIWYIGRQASDGYVSGSVQLKAGEGYYLNSDSYGRNRWGDYSGIALDPSRGTIWINNEYATAFNTWGTWFGELSFNTPSTITVTSPTGGETWYAGDTNTITWSSSNAGSDVKIEVSRDGGSTWSSITGSTPNVGSYAWTVTSPTSSACRIRITSISYPSATDMSSANFIIAARSITVTSPTGGETWYAGDTNTITWSSSNAGSDVKIEVSRDGGSTWSSITGSTPNVGSYAWTVTSPTSSACRIRITSISYPSATDMSSVDFIIAAPQPIVTITCVPDSTIISRGGTLNYTVTITNNANVSTTILVATNVTKTDGSTYPAAGYLIGPLSVYLGPYESKSGHKSHTIPTGATLGHYIYHGYVGKVGVGLIYECQFDFDVTL
jgi:hypothetical protein